MLEGAEAPESVHSTRVMKSNICQIMSKATSVSGTLNALNPHGIGNEFANEIADRLLELKRDMEYFFISGAKAVESDSTPRQMDGLMNLVGHSIDLESGALTEDMSISGPARPGSKEPWGWLPWPGLGQGSQGQFLPLGSSGHHGVKREGRVHSE